MVRSYGAAFGRRRLLCRKRVHTSPQLEIQKPARSLLAKLASPQVLQDKYAASYKSQPLIERNRAAIRFRYV